MKTKKQIVLIISLFVISGSLWGQNKKNYTNIHDLKGINQTYEIGDGEIGYGVWNKQNKCKDITPTFLGFEVIPPIKITNKVTLDALVREHLKPYFLNQNSFSSSYLYIYLYTDIYGNIKEIYIRYPKNIGIIPGNVIEQFEIALLKSNVKLLFDKNNRVFKNSQWIGREVMYRADKMKDL